MSVASAANESWTSGVTAVQPQMGAVEGVRWVVVTDAQSIGDRIIASQFRLALVSLSFESSWFASGELAFTRELGSMGAGRCCGPVVLYEWTGTKTINGPDHTPRVGP